MQTYSPTIFHRCLVVITLFASSTVQASRTENWECALNLHQDQQGTLTIERSQESITGSFDLEQNGHRITQTVDGIWKNDKIELQRVVNPTNKENFRGIALSGTDGQVSMAGRFGAGFKGLWSAECALSSSLDGSAQSETQRTPTAVEPSTSMRVRPFKPSSVDPLQFDVTAAHPSGIESVAIVVDGKEIKQCNNSNCSASYGPLSAGAHSWHVIATSKSGIKNTKQKSPLNVRGTDSATGCIITGLATGSAVARSNAVNVKLTGEQQNRLTTFDGGVYRFTNLPAGNYTLSVITPASSGLLSSPATKSFNCQPGQTIQQNFELQ